MSEFVDRAANFTPQRAGRVRFHLDQQLARTRVICLAERSGDCEIARVSFSSQLAKFRDSLRNRRGRIEAQFTQPRVVAIEIFRIHHFYVSRMKSVSRLIEPSKLFGGSMNCQVLIFVARESAGFATIAGM